MSDEDAVAAEGTLKSAADTALALAWPLMEAKREEDARAAGYSGYSEQLWADAYHAEQRERGYY